MGKTVKIYQVLLTVLFLTIISFCFLNDVLRFYKVPDISPTENRKLAVKPVFDASNLDPFAKSYTNYFNDQFPFRQELGFLNTLICFFYFHQSPLPGEVELGRNGWLFYDQKESVVYQGKFSLSKQQVKALVKELRDRTISYGKKGMKFYVAFPPLKPEIYPEYLPVDFKRAAEGTVTDRIVEAIKEDTVIRYIDLKEALLKAKNQGRLYYQLDNHWNWLGAFYGYTAIMDRLKKDFPRLKPLTRQDVNFKVEKTIPGNLATMIGLSKYLSETDYNPFLKVTRTKLLTPTHQRPDWAAQVANYEVVRTTGDSSLPDAVVIHDSYTDGMMPYLNESFNNYTYIFDGWRYEKNDAIIDDLKPEIVLLIIFEPHISHLAGKW
ncbi:MAG: hypothetical protein WCJ26_02600 [bacterium]